MAGSSIKCLLDNFNSQKILMPEIKFNMYHFLENTFCVSYGFWNRETAKQQKFEPVHEISNNVVCATSKTSDQPTHMRSLIRAFASRLSIL